MRRHELLFREGDLSRILDTLAADALDTISTLSASQVDPRNDENLVKELSHKFVVNPLRLHRDKMTREDPREIAIELSGDQAFFYGEDQVKGRGIEITFIIPFDGDPWLFKSCPNSWTSIYPEGEIVAKEYRLTLRDPERNKERVEQNRDRQIQLVQDYIRRQETQIRTYNERIIGVIKNALDQRRSELQANVAFAEAFGVPERKPDPPAEPDPSPAKSQPAKRQHKPRVFICYAKEDVAKAEEIFQDLEAAGADPWLDKEKLVLGDNWEHEIKKAVAAADAFVACLRAGFDEIGFRQQEVRWAIEALQRRPPGRGFIIPFIIEPCELPDWCKQFHAGEYHSKPTSLEELAQAVEKHCGWHPSPQTPEVLPPPMGITDDQTDLLRCAHVATENEFAEQRTLISRAMRRTLHLKEIDPLTPDQISSIRELDFTGEALSDVGAALLAAKETGLISLGNLNLTGTLVTDEGLKTLAARGTGVPTLTKLNLKFTKVSDGTLKALASPNTGLAALTELDLDYTKVTDAGVAALASKGTGLTALTKLSLGKTIVTDNAVKALASKETGLRRLAILFLAETFVTDDGIRTLAAKNSGLSALTNLYLWSTHVTDECVQTVCRACPKLIIHR